MTNLLVPILFLTILIFIVFSAILDFKKPRRKTSHPIISFIVPCYNCEKTVKDCIESIYRSYKRDKIEILAIDDNSKDGTNEILKILSKKFNFNIFKNKENLGKTRSINSIWKKSKGELIWIVDSDIILNKNAVDECLRRLYSDESVGAVSCRYKIIKRGLLSWMVGLEFNIIAISNWAYNLSTALSMWGGCSAYKRKAFSEINGLRENMIAEDMDSALRLGKKGWRVEQCFNSILTYSPSTIKGWYKQKIKWSSGGMQCFLSHTPSFIKNPISVLFMISYSLGILLNSLEISSLHHLDIGYLTSIGLMILISSPYFFLEMDNFKDLKKFFYLVLFVVVYYPIFLVVSLIGLGRGIYKYFILRKGGRGW